MALLLQPNSTPTWDAYTSFNVTGRFSRGMNCIGINRHGRRCAWDIPKVKYDDLRRILDWVETQPPQDAEKYLRDIASLSLCQDFHQNQSYDFVEDWRAMLKKIPYAVAETGPTLEEKFQRLQEKSVEWQKTKASLEAQVDKYKAQLSSLEVSLGGQLHIDRQNLEAERQKVEALQIDRDNRLVEASKKIEYMKEEIKGVKEEIRIYGQNIADLESTVVLSTKQKEKMKQQIAEQEAELKTRSENIEILENAKLSLLQKVDNLSFLLEDGKETLQEAQEKSETVENMNSSLLREIKNLNSQLEESKRTIEALEAGAAEAEIKERKLSDRARNLQTYLEEERKVKADLEETLSDKLQSLDAELATRTGSAAALSKEVDRLKKENGGVLGEKEILQANLDLGEGELARLLEQLRLSNQRNEDARKRPFRFMTKCWLEKVQTNRKKDTLNEFAWQGKRNTQRSELASS
ncbi:uncharacterized protein PAC_06342 [Phialocephala subalpina]|uniref:Uncharacterized protein n=1 Tax=Phialocephala subalpina TaxID=576137 RepID=A0A1L7WUJ2_9HELO|nr:uncharacterized protein PAC_06342 [Phialocephala subalpina]